MPTSEQIQATAEGYAAAVTKADKDAILDCFTDDAVVVDPYPADAYVGRDAISAFWDNVFLMGVPQSFVIEHIACAGDSAAFLFQIKVKVGDGLFGVKGFDIINVDDSGKITSLTAYWDPSHFAPVS